MSSTWEYYGKILMPLAVSTQYTLDINEHTDEVENFDPEIFESKQKI